MFPQYLTITDVHQKLSFTKTNGKAFWVDIMLVGSMGSGKTTLLNAIESDFVGQTGLGKTTATIHQYSECSDIKTNNSALQLSTNVNKQQNEKNKVDKMHETMLFWDFCGLMQETHFIPKEAIK